MSNPKIVGAAAVALIAVVYVVGSRALENVGPSATASPPTASSAEAAAPDLLYGRVTTYGGDTYEGRLRWGGDEEALWGHTFDGVKDENPWAALTPRGRRAEEGRPARVFGVEVPWGGPEVDLGRPFMARFGDIARIEAHGDGVRGVLADGVAFDPDVRVTLKSGTVFDLDRLSASDFDDGVRVWDGRRGAVDLGPRQIRTVELFPAPDDVESRPRDGGRLHGTVHTSHGDFTGLLQWDRDGALGRDEIVGRTADGERRLRFDAIRSIARDPRGGSRVTRLDGREVALSGTSTVGPGHRGIAVDDARYGRVLVPWGAVERVDLDPSASGPSYDDFPPGRPLSGRVTTRDGRRLTGRLVVDLDESETTETLDAPSRGVDYSVPFGRIASVVLPGDGPARVTLRDGKELALERAGDLGDGNAGLLVFADGQEGPEYVPWAEVERIDIDRPAEPADR
ncbi:hypothetical protein [Rubrivirga sp.]|uniref:hypothetical protein n=1 Tax=Rubrivirga sp. TaxID=1885344 RepID=UPI003B5157F6